MKAATGGHGVVGGGMVEKGVYVKQGDLSQERTVFMSKKKRTEEPLGQESEPS